MKSGVVADFEVPGEQERAIRVSFEKALIFRVLDELLLSTENEDSKPEGLISEHFAYLVEDSAFFKAQSEAFRIIWPKARHYRFVTGSACFDVISDVPPSLEVVSHKLQST
jgi:hypothetical protein